MGGGPGDFNLTYIPHERVPVFLDPGAAFHVMERRQCGEVGRDVLDNKRLNMRRVSTHGTIVWTAPGQGTSAMRTKVHTHLHTGEESGMQGRAVWRTLSGLARPRPA